jgi:hypothetical protein
VHGVAGANAPRAGVRVGLAGWSTEPETRLLAAVTAPDRTVEAIAAAVEGCRDWERVLRMAAVNRVIHQLAIALKSEGLAQQVPTGVRFRLAELARQAATLDWRYVADLGEIVERFQRAGVPLMVLKGLALAETLYPAACERLSSDIDLVVPARALETAEEVLLSLGYRAVRREYYGRAHFHIPYIRRHGRLTTTVELHWHVVGPTSAVRFDIDAWWREARPQTLRAGRVLLPPLAEELSYLCHHAFLDGSVTLRSLEDVARWVAAHGAALDWPAAVVRADRARAQYFVHQTLALAARLWKPQSEKGGQFPAPPRARRWLARNLVHPATVVETGNEAWWPYQRIGYWSMLGPGEPGLWGLLSRTMRRRWFSDWSDPPGGAPFQGGRALALALALVLCAGPHRVFPSQFRAQLSGRKPSR